MGMRSLVGGSRAENVAVGGSEPRSLLASAVLTGRIATFR